MVQSIRIFPFHHASESQFPVNACREAGGRCLIRSIFAAWPFIWGGVLMLFGRAFGMPFSGRKRLRGRRPWDAALAGVTSAALGVTLLSAPAWAAAAPAFEVRDLPKQESVDGQDLPRQKKSSRPGQPNWAPSPVRWPAEGTASVTLDRSASGKSRTAVGKLPVRLSPGAASASGKALKSAGTGEQRVQVAVKSRDAARRAGVEGLLLTVGTPAGGPGAGGAVRVEVDYSAVRHAYGAGWASRLQLVSLPACALTTPDKAQCRTRTPLASANDTSRQAVSANVTLPDSGGSVSASSRSTASAAGGVAVLAATASTSGSEGSFKATSLAPSGSWSAGGNSGGFAWNLPIDVPQVPGGLLPKVGLSYSSSSVDGRTASTNNQSSWVGEGWEYSPGFIERRYVGCESDRQGGNNSEKVGDLCWKSENATLSLNGSSTELVWDAGKKVWKLANDDGSRIERIYDSPGNGSGDADSEYWKLTTNTGTQYWFGKNRLPGWSEGKEATNSVLTAPVYGNHDGEPGHGSDFASSAEQQGWRWMLDYVVDPHGNAMTLHYTKEVGYYAQNKKLDDPKPYTRGGYLTRIDYGLRADAVYSTANPAGRVTFDVAERCLADCGTFDEDHAANWPDTPVDADCKAGTECLQGGPSFWTRKRLTGINTFSLVDSTLTPVDTWALKQTFPGTGDISTPSMWLDSVQRTAKAGALADITMPATLFAGETKPNRVDAAEGRPPLNKKRLTQVTSETGADTLVTYSTPQCTPTTLPTADTNTKRCYPAWWTVDGAVDPVKDWFHKYVVTQVIEDDTTAGTGSPSKVTTYEYADGPHWRKDTGEFTLDKHRSWSDFRGYGTVRVLTGSTNRTKTETSYYLGMAGDTLADGTARTVAKINGITDREDFAGRPASTRTFDKDGSDGKIVAKTTQIPWESAATATQAVKGITDPDKPSTPAPTLPAKTARYPGTATETSSTLLDDNTTWRTLTTRRTYDDTYGLLVREGDDGAGLVEGRCVRTTFVTPDLDNWLIAYPAEVTNTDQRDCSLGYLLPNVTGKARTFYDGNAAGAAPTPGKANTTKTQQAASFDLSGQPVWETVDETSYDQYGRPLTVKGQDNQTTTTVYSPASGAQPNTVATTNAKGHESVVMLDPSRGLTLKSTDANGRSTHSEYDALGRLTRGWGIGRAQSASPNAVFTYNISSTHPSTVTTKALRENGTWGTSVTIYDSLLRARQTQIDAIGTAGRVITDTLYDDQGRVHRTNSPYYNDQTTSGTLYNVPENQIPSTTLMEYDGRGRPTASIVLALNTEKWRTTTTYGATWTATTPPAGGTATLNINDVRERPVEERSYKDHKPFVDAAASQYEAIAHTYDKAGRLAKLTDTSKRTSWYYTYDLRGRQLTAKDPDKGLATTTYGADGRVETVTDARGTTLATTYDALGRKTSLRTGSTAGTKLAEWTYDTATGGKGLPATSVRYDAAVSPHAAYSSAVTGYDSAGQATGTTVTVPSVPGEEKLAGTYTVNTTATPVSGLPKTAVYSTGNVNATTALPAETVTHHYGAQDQLAIVDGTLNQAYLRGAAYTPFGELAQSELGNLGARVINTNTYDLVTGRLTKSIVDREATGPATLSNIKYTYDDAGNVTRIRDDQNDSTVADDQCFAYDWARRMTEAWTTGDACTTRPVNGSGTPSLGTVDPYWTSWTFTDTGQRATETQHKAGTVTADTTRTYTYPTGTDTPQAHALRTVTATGGATGTDTYTWDATGNLTQKKPATGPAQDLTWNEEGKLATSTTSGATTSFLYDAENTRILKREPTNTTLYLPGGQELVLTKSTNTLAGTRYYSVPGGSAVRTSSDNRVRLLIADHHNTNTLSITATTLAVNRRKTTPYGAPRGTAPFNWPSKKGFVDGDIDPTTNFTHIGDREYDTTLGQFLSIDPIVIPGQPSSLNGYSYAGNNPVTYSDPTGLALDPGNGRAHQSTTTGSGRAGHRDTAFELDPGVNVSTSGYWGKKGTQPRNSGSNPPAKPTIKPSPPKPKFPGLIGIVANLQKGIDISSTIKRYLKPGNLSYEEFSERIDRCQSSTGMSISQCANLPMFIVDGKRTPEIAINDKSAQDAGHPMLLHYAARNETQKRHIRELAGCGSSWSGPQSCDEYPFASSEEGGIGAHLRSVPFIPEQKIQAMDLSAFYRSNRMKKGDPFLVIVINVRRNANGSYTAG
ncbi:NucA/NucB deoxyribonuclease domain-containing protein [Streptomyces zhihengii]